MKRIADDFKLTGQTVQRMMELLRAGAPLEFIAQGLNVHYVHPALTQYLRGPWLSCHSGSGLEPDWLPVVVRLDRLTSIVAEHQQGLVGSLAAYGDVLAYLYPAAQALPARWVTIYIHVSETTLARHEWLSPGEIGGLLPHQAGCLTAGEEARLRELRQELRSAIVKLARQQTIAGRLGPVLVTPISFHQLAKGQAGQNVGLNLTQERFNHDPETETTDLPA